MAKFNAEKSKSRIAELAKELKVSEDKIRTVYGKISETEIKKLFGNVKEAAPNNTASKFVKRGSVKESVNAPQSKTRFSDKKLGARLMESLGSKS